jgi:eukaryotic-like serine/threonine-protein kinase
VSNRDDILGSYRLTKQIARGNATQIWEAIKLGTTDRFVIKVLNRDNRGDKEEIAFLRHEFEVAHELDHPNVIRVFEMNPLNPAYIVLEIFSVLNLKQVLRQDRERILVSFYRIVEQCGASLAHLHEHGWVHCDVKPDNFLINETDDIKLIDFTIARKSAKGFFAKMFGGQKTIRGTRSYMSPEQIRGKPIDDRGDIYSFGCLLFELLTGKLPYTGVNPNELLNKHLTAAIPNVQVYNNNVTDEMAALLRETMAKEPASRPKTMGDVLKQLKATRIFRTAPKRTEQAPTPKANP